MKELEGRILSEEALKIIECLSENGWEGYIGTINNDYIFLRYKKDDIYVAFESFVLLEENNKLFRGESFTVYPPNSDQVFSCYQLDTVMLGIKEEFGNRERYCEFWDEATNTIVHLYYVNDNPKIEYFSAESIKEQ